MKRIWKREGESKEDYLKRLEEVYQEIFEDNLFNKSLINYIKEKEREIITRKQIEARQ